MKFSFQDSFKNLFVEFDRHSNVKINPIKIPNYNHIVVNFVVDNLDKINLQKRIMLNYNKTNTKTIL